MLFHSLVAGPGEPTGSDYYECDVRPTDAACVPRSGSLMQPREERKRRTMTMEREEGWVKVGGREDERSNSKNIKMKKGMMLQISKDGKERRKLSDSYFLRLNLRTASEKWRERDSALSLVCAIG